MAKFVKKAKFEKLGNEVIFGHWNGQKFILKKEGKVSRLPYLVLVSTKPEICKDSLQIQRFNFLNDQSFKSSPKIIISLSLILVYFKL
jgi:hypothetical protein